MKFLKNISTMGLGMAVQYIMVIISTPIFIRMIGLKGFGKLGIVYSFTGFIVLFFIPFYLTLVKYNRTKEFESLFNSNLVFIHLFNIMMLLCLVPIAIMLSKYVYQDTGLMILYMLVIMIAIVNRVVDYFCDTLRSVGDEPSLQKVRIPSLIIGFVSSLLMLTLGMGVISILLGNLITILCEYFGHLQTIKKHLGIRFTFDKHHFLTALKQFSIEEYKLMLIGKTSKSGILFLMSFFLSVGAMGFLTIVIAIGREIDRMGGLLRTHLIPLMNHHPRIIAQKIVFHMTSILNIVFIYVMIMLGLLGEKLYLLYYGPSMAGTYIIFIMFIGSALIQQTVLPQESLYFVKKTRPYIWFRIILVSLLIFSIMVLHSLFGLIGVAAGFLMVSLLRITTLYMMMILSTGHKLMKVAQGLLSITILTIAVALPYLYDMHIILSLTSIIIAYLIVSTQTWKHILTNIKYIKRL